MCQENAKKYWLNCHFMSTQIMQQQSDKKYSKFDSQQTKKKLEWETNHSSNDGKCSWRWLKLMADPFKNIKETD